MVGALEQMSDMGLKISGALVAQPAQAIDEQLKLNGIIQPFDGDGQTLDELVHSLNRKHTILGAEASRSPSSGPTRVSSEGWA